MATILKLMIATMFVLSVSACNTMSGAGKDIQAGGEKLENAADKAK